MDSLETPVGLTFKIPEGQVIDLEKTNLLEGKIYFKDKEPMTEEELLNTDVMGGWMIDGSMRVVKRHNSIALKDVQFMSYPTQSEALRAIAYCKLLWLRKNLVGDWRPIKVPCVNLFIYNINVNGKIIRTLYRGDVNYPLCFPTRDRAVLFAESYTKLIDEYTKRW